MVLLPQNSQVQLRGFGLRRGDVRLLVVRNHRLFLMDVFLTLGCVRNSCTSERLPEWFVDFVTAVTHQDKEDVALGTVNWTLLYAQCLTSEWNATGGGLSIEYDEDDQQESTQQQLHVRGQGRQIRVGGAPPPRQQARPQGGIQAQAAVGQSRPASPDRGRPQGGW